MCVSSVGGLREEVTVLQRERDEERSQAEAMMEARLREKERQHSLQEAKVKEGGIGA